MTTPIDSGPPALRTRWSNPVPQPVSAVAYAPSGDRVAAATASATATDSSGSLTVYDALTGAVLRRTRDDWAVSSLAFSPDGQWLATAERRFHAAQDEWRARVLNAATGDERCRYTGSPVSAQVMFGPDGTWIVAHGQYGSGHVRVWSFDAFTGVLRWARDDLDAGSAVACGPDGASVAVGHRNGVAVLDAHNGTDRVRPALPSVTAVTYSPDARTIVAGCGDGTIRAFDAAGTTVEWTFGLGRAGHAEVRSVAVSDNGKWVAAVVDDAVGVFDLARGRPRFTLLDVTGGTQVVYSPTLRHILVNARDALPVYYPDPFFVPYAVTMINAWTGGNDGIADQQRATRLAGAPDGTALLAGLETGDAGGVVTMYELGVVVSRHLVGAPLTSIAMSPAGTALVAAADTGAAVTVIAAATGATLARNPVPGTIAAAVFADGGQTVAAGGSDGLRLFSVRGDRSWKLDGIGPVNALVPVGPAGDRLAVASGRTVSLVGTADGHPAWPAPVLHPQTVTRLAAAPGGTWLATGCTDRTARLIDARTGAVTFGSEGDGRVRALAFQPDGSLLAAGNEDGTVALVDTATASVRAPLTHPVGCSHLAFGAATLAVAWDDNSVHVFDVATAGAPPRKLREIGLAAPVSALAFNPAGDGLAIATGDRNITVYDARAGTELARIPHPLPAPSFAFSADGSLIATICDDDIVRVWASGYQDQKEASP